MGKQHGGSFKGKKYQRAKRKTKQDGGFLGRLFSGGGARSKSQPINLTVSQNQRGRIGSQYGMLQYHRPQYGPPPPRYYHPYQQQPAVLVRKKPPRKAKQRGRYVKNFIYKKKCVFLPFTSN
jgi:hypothetical protein